MKKLLSLLSALFLVGTCSTSVVSCFAWPVDGMKVTNTNLSSYTSAQLKEMGDAINLQLGRANILKPSNSSNPIDSDLSHAVNFKSEDLTDQGEVNLKDIFDSSFPAIEVLQLPQGVDEQKKTAIEGFNKRLVFGFVKNYLETKVKGTNINLLGETSFKPAIKWDYMYQPDGTGDDADANYALIDPSIDWNNKFVKNPSQSSINSAKIHVKQVINPDVYLGNDNDGMKATKDAIIDKLYQFSGISSMIGDRDLTISLSKKTTSLHDGGEVNLDDWMIKKGDVINVKLTGTKTGLFTGSISLSFTFTGLLYDITDIKQVASKKEILTDNQMEYSVIVDVKNPKNVTAEELAAAKIFYQLRQSVIDNIEAYVKSVYDVDLSLSGDEFEINMSVISAGDYSMPKTLSMMVISKPQNKLIYGSYSARLMVSAIADS